MAKTWPEAKKQELLANLIGARSEIIDAATAVPRALLDSPFLGVWSTHDIVAHLIGWDHANREALTAIQARSLPAFYAEYDADWRTYNARLIKQFKRPSCAETMGDATVSHRTLLAALEVLPPDDFARDYGVRSPRGRRVTISMLLQAEAEDERKHARQIRALAREHGASDAL